jgi:hypothetical protein
VNLELMVVSLASVAVRPDQSYPREQSVASGIRTQTPGLSEMVDPLARALVLSDLSHPNCA